MFSRLNVGGPSIHVILLTAGLSPEHFETLLIVGREDAREGSMLDFAERHGVKPERLGVLGRKVSLVNDLRSVWRLLVLMRRWRPDLVHTHTAKAGFTGRLAARLAGVPLLVHTFHGHVFEGYFGAIPSRLLAVIERLLAHGTDAIIAISPRLKADLVRRGIAPPNKIRVIPLGLELGPLLAVTGPQWCLRRELGLGASEPLVGIVGRLVPIKDHATFLAAAQEIAALRPEAHFVIVGDGELRNNLERDAALRGLGSRVHFTGWRSDLAAVYSDLDLVILCSRNEGTPVSLIEASAAGRPVIATDVGGVRDLIEEGVSGLLVPPGDPAALAQASLRLLSNKALAAELAARARERVASRYNVARLISDTQELYRELLSRKVVNLQVPR